MLMRTHAASIALSAVVVAGALAGCSSNTSTEIPASSRATSLSAAPTPAKSVGDLADSGVTPVQVYDAFKSADLPVVNPRDNTENACASMPSCVALETTDSISIYKFNSEKDATTFAAPGSGYRNKDIVLSYAAARTPESEQPKYEAALDQLMAG